MNSGLECGRLSRLSEPKAMLWPLSCNVPSTSEGDGGSTWTLLDEKALSLSFASLRYPITDYVPNNEGAPMSNIFSCETSDILDFEEPITERYPSAPPAGLFLPASYRVREDEITEVSYLPPPMNDRARSLALALMSLVTIGCGLLATDHVVSMICAATAGALAHCAYRSLS